MVLWYVSHMFYIMLKCLKSQTIGAVTIDGSVRFHSSPQFLHFEFGMR